MALAVSASVGLGSVAAAGIGASVAYVHTQQAASAYGASQTAGPQDSSGSPDVSGPQGNSGSQGFTGESDDGGQGTYVPGDDNNSGGLSQQAPPLQVLPGTGSSPHTNSSGS